MKPDHECRITFRGDGTVSVDGKPRGIWRHDIQWFATVDFVTFAPRRTRAELVEAITVMVEREES